MAMFMVFTLSALETGLAMDIIVGGREHWHFGFNYSAWAAKADPFFENDVLGT